MIGWISAGLTTVGMLIAGVSAYVNLDRDVDDLRRQLSELRAENESAHQALLTKIEQVRKEAIAGAKILPQGTVLIVADEDGCPERGWDDYDKARGKFIIGAGLGILEPKGDHEHASQPGALMRVDFEDQGGEEKHTLTETEMPGHGHPFFLRGSHFQVVPGGTRAHEFDPRVEPRQEFETSPVGSSAPHNNMPPFIALYFCKKET